MTTIVLYASDQLLNVVSKPRIASGDMNSVLLRVEFDSIWDRFTKSAVFFTANNEEETYEMILSDNECTIPHEVLEEAGILNIGIRGVDSDTNAVKTSTLVKYRIEEGAPSGSGTTEEPTPTVYHQILALSEETRDIVAESEQKIQNLNYASGSWTPTIANATFDGLVVEGRFTKVGSTVHLWCTLSADFYGKGECLDIGGFYPNCGVPSVPWLSSGIMNSNVSARSDGFDSGVRLIDDGNQYYLRISNPVTRQQEGVCTIFVSADYATTSVLDQSEVGGGVGAVRSVNGKTGVVRLSAADVGADATGTAQTVVSSHNTSTNAHNDIRLLIEGLTTRLNALANSTDADLDQMAEIVTYIKSNKNLIDGITTSKVNVSDIINNLTTNASNKPLSAAQGVALKKYIDDALAEFDGGGNSGGGSPGGDYMPKSGGTFTGDVKVQINKDYVRLTQGGIEINNDETDNGFFINSVGEADEPVAEFIGSACDAPVRLTNIATPKLNSDAATKRYVDTTIENYVNEAILGGEW